MSWETTAVPAGWVTVTSGKHCRLFLEGDALTFTLSASTATSYEVRDYYGTVVASGSASGTSLTVPAQDCGWYKLYLNRVATDPTYGTLIGASMFAVLKDHASFEEPPAAGTAFSTGYASENHDQVLRAIMQSGPDRVVIGNAAAPTTGLYTIALAEGEAEFPPAHDTFCLFANGTNGGEAGVTQSVTAIYPSISHYEGPVNEPDLRPGTSPGPDGYATQTGNFADAVHDVAGAKAMGPAVISVNGGQTANLATYFANGGGDSLDAISFHAYNSINGDLILGRRSMDEFTRILADHSLDDLELWMTEWGIFAADYGVWEHRRQLRWWAMHRFVLEQYGIPKDRDQWFYDGSHGFWNYPSTPS